jgi:ubiquinone biosynthesis protein
MIGNEELGSDGEHACEGDDWLASLGVDEVVPSALAPWRPLVVEALEFFLDRLPPPRLAAIMADQFALDGDASPARRLVALLAHCPTLHKLGQVLARNAGLHPELRSHLQSLESMPATVPMTSIHERIRHELAGAPTVVVADAALAEGSVAVVLPFSYRDQGILRDGVFKVLKPGIETKLADELAILPALASFLERRGRQLDLPPIDYRDHLTSVQRLLTREIRLELEQRHMRDAAAFHADEPRVWVPRVLPWSTPRMTAMERVFGMPVNEAALSTGRRRELADLMMSALIAKPFWTRSHDAVFHADLHGGNLLVADDGRLAVIDWSLTACVSKVEREALVAIVTGALTLDAVKIRHAVAALGSLNADDAGLAAVVDRALDRLVLQGRLPGFGWLLGMLDELALRGAAGFREDLALFRKTWLSLAGVIGDLAGPVSPDIPLLRVGLRQFLAELPARFLAVPGSADFSTHVSSADLLQLGASSALTSLRYWTRLGRLAYAPSFA